MNGESLSNSYANEKKRTYIAIDLKSFYASVECEERGLDPLNTNLVVADVSRTEKTICLAVSPSLKKYGIPGRARLFEVVQRLREVNLERLQRAPGRTFTGESYDSAELDADPSLKISYIAAVPQMKKYMEYSRNIFNIYLKYIAPEDIHVYSIDEIFADVTEYLDTYGKSAHELVTEMIHDVYDRTGITATAGIGTNLYLCKIAMDIVAKHMPPDSRGVRIAQLDERKYRELLWNHTPITDFWRVGHGYASRLAQVGLYTMGDIARCSIGKLGDYYNEDLLYDIFGINAELLIDHAWGYECVTIADIKGYRPEFNSVSSGQVLQSPYENDKARLVVREMTDQLALDLFSKGLATDQLVLTISYDVENLTDSKRAKAYKGEVTVDYYGRKAPKHAHGTVNLPKYSSSSSLLMDAVDKLFADITDPVLLVRRIGIAACRVKREEDIAKENAGSYEQLDLFTDYSARDRKRKEEEQLEEREKRMQQAILDIKSKYGKNAILRGMNLEEGATAISRNSQVGGHKA